MKYEIKSKKASARAAWATRATRGLTLAALAASVVWACADPLSDQGPAIEFDRRGMLASLAKNVLAPTYAEFASAADDLVAATQAYADAVKMGASDVDDRRTAAQDAYSAAADVWQRAEAMRVGPAGSSINRLGGADLGDAIYSWPTSDSCAIDRDTSDGSFANKGFLDDALVNVYGLDALEYLLFIDSPDNTCPPQDAINGGPWDALGEDQVAVRRSAYAAIVAQQVADAGHELATDWDPESGDFTHWLSNPSASGSPFVSDLTGVDEVLGAIFRADLALKNDKLGRPSGQTECTTDTCPEDLESPWGDRAKENALANLEGLRQMFLGGKTAEAGKGFDDFLAAAGAPDVADKILADLDAAVAAVNAVPMSFSASLAADPAALDEAYDAVETLTSDLKGPFTMALQVRVPGEAAGDGD